MIIKGRWTTIYLDRNDWWVGYYRGSHHHYICPLPTLVIRIDCVRRQAPLS